jgi:hypothetical protein
MAVPVNPKAPFKTLNGFVTSVENITTMAMKIINEVEVDELYV